MLTRDRAGIDADALRQPALSFTPRRFGLVGDGASFGRGDVALREALALVLGSSVPRPQGPGSVENAEVKWPRFNKNGDLPPGLYRASLAEVIEYFGQATLRRQVMARRLERIYTLAAATDHLARFIVYGSFVTAKPDPGDVDVFMLMDETFDVDRVSPEQRPIFNHMIAHDYEGASVFWSSRGALMGGEQELVEHWQLARDGTRRGIVEVTDHD